MSANPWTAPPDQHPARVSFEDDGRYHVVRGAQVLRSCTTIAELEHLLGDPGLGADLETVQHLAFPAMPGATGHPHDDRPLFRVRSRVLGIGGLVVAVHGELDIATTPHLLSRLRALPVGERDRVIVDLTPLAFCDAGGARALVAGYDDLAARAGEVTVVAPPRGIVRRVITIAAGRRLPLHGRAPDVTGTTGRRRAARPMVTHPEDKS